VTSVGTHRRAARRRLLDYNNEFKTDYEYYKRGGKLLLTFRGVPEPDIPVGVTTTCNGQRIVEATAIRTIAKTPIDEVELHETYFRADGKITYEGTIIVYLLDSDSGVFGGGTEEHRISGVKRYGAFPDWPSGQGRWVSGGSQTAIEDVATFRLREAS
jgi:hypothetical protein